MITAALSKVGTCHTCNHPACPTPGIKSRHPEQGCPLWTKTGKAATLDASAPAALVPALKVEDPDKVTADFKKAFDTAQGAVKVIAAFGVFAAHVKYNLLKHGQFGAWVTANFGQESYRSVRGHMQLAEGILGRSGVKSLKAFVSKWQSLPICHRGEFLLTEESQVPEPVRKVRAKALDVMDNKTAHPLFLEFKQAEEDDQAETVKPKRGRLKGHGGASKEQRAAAAAVEEKARLEAIELESKQTGQWLTENADDKHIGAISDKAKDKLFEALETMRAYLLNDRKARGANKG